MTTPITGAADAPAREPITLDVTLRVTVSPDAWDLAYGTGTLPEAVAEDVRTYVLNHVLNSPAGEEGALTAVHLLDVDDVAPPAPTLTAQATAVLALHADGLVRLADRALRAHRGDIALVLLREARASLVVDIADRAGADLSTARPTAARHTRRIQEQQLTAEQRIALAELVDAERTASDPR